MNSKASRFAKAFLSIFTLLKNQLKSYRKLVFKSVLFVICHVSICFCIQWQIRQPLNCTHCTETIAINKIVNNFVYVFCYCCFQHVYRHEYTNAHNNNNFSVQLMDGGEGKTMVKTEHRFVHKLKRNEQ